MQLHFWEDRWVAQSKDPTINLDRRQDDRRQDDRRKEEVPVDVERRTSERRKVQRRRQIDPTTCERDYTNDEIEFMQAMDAYKRSSGRMFPTCSEILEVVRNLGYARVSNPVATEEPALEEPAALEEVSFSEDAEVPEIDE
jgi:hypothetical protein